ncbi:terpenoid synthase [Hymenopellis radicata]|nr:terpenoid synthase [Hymenopellis radicata]
MSKQLTFPEWSAAHDSAVLEPYNYVLSNPGKDIRGKILESLRHISRIMNMLHTASLLIDDIQDDSKLRRGKAAAHRIYGYAQTINSANYVYFLAYKELECLQQDAVKCGLVSILNEEMLSLHRGQGIELFWRDHGRCPTENEYIGMVNQKTGGLFRIGIRLMMSCATTNTETDYIPLANLMGVYFQIRDDLMNLRSNDYSNKKGFAEDITEGKFSFPIIHSLNLAFESVEIPDSDTMVLNILKQRPTTPTLKHQVISYLKDTTMSFEYTEKVLRDLETRIREDIARLGGNKGLSNVMEVLGGTNSA